MQGYLGRVKVGFDSKAGLEVSLKMVYSILVAGRWCGLCCSRRLPVARRLSAAGTRSRHEEIGSGGGYAALRYRPGAE